MRDIIINLQNSGTWKIQLTIAINFVFSKYVDEECVMHSKSDNIEFMPYDNANEVVNELFKSLLWRYQFSLEKSKREWFDFWFSSTVVLQMSQDKKFLCF